MDQQQVRWAVLKISSLALIVSTWTFISFVLSTKPDAQVEPLMSWARLPASVPTRSVAIEPIRMEAVQLGCWDLSGAETYSVAARWVRIVGRPCQSDSTLETIRIRNMTNGYEGTIFASQKDQMTTDFIPLQQGTNNIRISVNHEDGVVVENQFTLVKTLTE